MLLPALGKAKARANRIKCTSNLKQISTALKAFAGENDDRMPWHLTGTTGLTAQYYVFTIFDRDSFPTLVKNLSHKVLLSPCDPRNKADNDKWQSQRPQMNQLGRNNYWRGLSYGVCHGGDELSPTTVLGGSRNAGHWGRLTGLGHTIPQWGAGGMG